MVVSEGPWHQNGHRWVLNPCPWNSAHTNRSAFIVQFASGAIAAGCHHNGCSGNDWHALREIYEPGWQPPTPPATLHVGSQNGTAATPLSNANAAPASTGQAPTTPGAARQLRVTSLATVRPIVSGTILAEEASGDRAIG